eukprot:357798-Chlamydomonas_euryale.AAC.16
MPCAGDCQRPDPDDDGAGRTRQHKWLHPTVAADAGVGVHMQLCPSRRSWCRCGAVLAVVSSTCPMRASAASPCAIDPVVQDLWGQACGLPLRQPYPVPTSYPCPPPLDLLPHSPHTKTPPHPFTFRGCCSHVCCGGG